MNQIHHLQKSLFQIRRRLCLLVDSLPDCAPGVITLNKNKTCCVVSLSTISKNKGILSPSYYLTKEVKDEMKRRIEKDDVEEIIRFVEGMIQSRKIVIGRQSNSLPGNFVDELREIWKEV
jgi:hypothetical protein